MMPEKFYPVHVCNGWEVDIVPACYGLGGSLLVHAINQQELRIELGD